MILTCRCDTTPVGRHPIEDLTVSMCQIDRVRLEFPILSLHPGLRSRGRGA